MEGDKEEPGNEPVGNEAASEPISTEDLKSSFNEMKNFKEEIQKIENDPSSKEDKNLKPDAAEEETNHQEELDHNKPAVLPNENKPLTQNPDPAPTNSNFDLHEEYNSIKDLLNKRKLPSQSENNNPLVEKPLNDLGNLNENLPGEQGNEENDQGAAGEKSAKKQQLEDELKSLKLELAELEAKMNQQPPAQTPGQMNSLNVQGDGTQMEGLSPALLGGAQQTPALMGGAQDPSLAAQIEKIKAEIAEIERKLAEMGAKIKKLKLLIRKKMKIMKMKVKSEKKVKK